MGDAGHETALSFFEVIALDPDVALGKRGAPVFLKITVLIDEVKRLMIDNEGPVDFVGHTDDAVIALHIGDIGERAHDVWGIDRMIQETVIAVTQDPVDCQGLGLKMQFQFIQTETVPSDGVGLPVGLKSLQGKTEVRRGQGIGLNDLNEAVGIGFGRTEAKNKTDRFILSQVNLLIVPAFKVIAFGQSALTLERMTDPGEVEVHGSIISIPVQLIHQNDYNRDTMNLRRLKKALLILILFLVVFPYLVPTDYAIKAPAKPFVNSVFYTTQDGVRLHARIYPAVGESKGKIILIHGLMASTFSYRNNSNALAENGYTVIAVDLPGFGYSDKPTWLKYTQANFAASVWEMLNDYDRKQDDNRPWHVVGHSMGASTALAMALLRPSLIVDITMIDGAVTQKSNSMGWVMGTPVGAWLKVVLRYGMLNRANFRKLLTDVYQTDVPQDAVEGYILPVQTQGTINGLIRFVQTSENVTIDQVKDLGLTINLIWGGKDTWIPIAAMDEIEAVVPIHKTYVFPNAGHTPHETEPLFNQVLIEMLSE